jgi:hypothetical protein
MGQITINTPQGPALVDIAGDTITEDELNRLREMAPPPEGETFEYTVVGGSSASPESKPTPEVEEIDGEIRSNSLRYQVARGDDDDDKALVLTELLGEGTFERVGEDTFVVDQSKVAPGIRRQYGLGDTGKVYVDKPGFSVSDITDFAGESGPAVAGAVGASIAVAGMATLPAMLIVGGTAAAFKAVDEGIEWLQGRNTQSAGEVAANVAIEGVLNAAFEGGGRYIVKGLGRLFKGPGPEVSSARIAEIQQSSGVTLREATRRAQEEVRQSFGQAVRQGAAPTIQAAAGKSLAARVLAINEKIVPNPKIGRKNVQYLESILEDVQSGALKQEDALKLMKSEYDAIASSLNIRLADPDQIFKVIQGHLDDIVKTELKAFEDAFVPAVGVPSQYVEGARLAANLFRAESTAAYDMAQRQIGKETLFDLKSLTDTIGRLKKDNRFVQYTGSLFDEIEKAAAGTVDDAGNKISGLGLSDLIQLKQALRLSAGNPDLIATSAQSGIGQIIKSVDEVLDSTFTNLSRDAARGYQLLRHPAGTVDEAGNRIGGRFYTNPLGPSENESLRQGLASWKQANDFYANGQEAINNVAVNSIIKNAKDKFYNSNIDVVKQIVEGGNAPKLRMYLNAATPSPTGAAKISRPGAAETIEQVKSLVDGPNPNLEAAADLIASSGLRDILPTLNSWVGKLPTNDVFRTMHIEQYIKELDSLSSLARAGANPQTVREGVRNGLASEWTERALAESQDPMGRFASGQFANKFTLLGDETQNLLFGVKNATQMRNVMGQFRMLGAGQDDAIRAFTDLPQGFGNFPAGSIGAQVQAFKQVVEGAKATSDDALSTAIQTGNITDPGSLVTSLLNRPVNYTRLRNVVGEEQLVRPGGVQDMVVQNLIRNSFNKLDEASIQSGSWGKTLRDSILKQNTNGALDTILGKDVVSNLTKVAEEAIKISDIPIKGYAGLAAATSGIAIATGMVALNVVSAGTAAAALVPIIVMSRALRNKTVLKLMTSPRLRAKEYEAAVRAGADLPSLKSLKAGGPLTYYANRLASIAGQEASIIAGSGILNVPISESEKEFREQQRTGVSPATGRTRTSLPPLAQTPSFDSIRRQLGPQSGTPSPSTGLDALRQVERNKLLGIAPGQ